MTDPKAPPPTDRTPDAGVSPTGHEHAEHGIPPGAAEEEPTAYPSSDRHQTEVGPHSGADGGAASGADDAAGAA